MADDTYEPRNYQDAIDAEDSSVDKIMTELGDDPSKELGVNPKELNKYDTDDRDAESDDRREQIEDLDEDSNQD